MIHTTAFECPGCGRPVNRRDATTVQARGCGWHSCCYLRTQVEALHVFVDQVPRGQGLFQMRNYSDAIARGKTRFGDKFDSSSLDHRFTKYYESQQRIKVETPGETLTGTVGITTGWSPCFILMRTRRSIGSMYTLGPRDTILAEKIGKAYRAVR